MTLQKQGIHRELRKVVTNGATAFVNGKKVIHLCSNDYLGLSRNTNVISKTIASLKEISQCSSRLIAGNDPRLLELEEMLASHRGTETALVYPSGYVANLGVVTAIADKDCAVFSDELNHASIIDACRLSGATIKVFKHNDIIHLRKLIRDVKGRKFIITEGIFSMDGDASRLQEICSVAHEYNALTIVDDAHGDFIFGPDFSGVPSMLAVDIDIHISSLSKGLGCFGGYVAASKQIRKILINTSRQFIYTSSLPYHLAVAALSAIPVAKKGDLQRKLQSNVNRYRREMERLGFTLGITSSQIIPVIVGEENLALQCSQELLKAGVFAQAIRFPTVKKGQARLRTSITAMHTASDLDLAVEAFKQVGKKFGII